MRKRLRFSQSEYVEGICGGNRMMLSRAITLIESSLNEDFELGQGVIGACLPHTGKAFRIGITGVPGAGKSTFIEAFGSYLTAQGLSLAVLAIDPTSTISGGSILGDKTRMQTLATNPRAFIRPSPSGGSLGGVTRKTREALLLCEAAGFDVIVVETVGVGQSETAVRDLTDFFLLLMLPNAGDDLQGIKKGIMEQADALLINKADGVLLPKARIAKTLYSQALRLFPAADSGWTPPVLMCSALENTGIEAVWEMLQTFRTHTQQNGFWEAQRQQQAIRWMHESIRYRLSEWFYHHPQIQTLIPTLEQQVLAHTLSPMRAVDILMEAIQLG